MSAEVDVTAAAATLSRRQSIRPRRARDVDRGRQAAPHERLQKAGKNRDDRKTDGVHLRGGEEAKQCCCFWNSNGFQTDFYNRMIYTILPKYV